MTRPVAPEIGRRRTVPIVIAAEAAECGLACMTMIGSYFGHRVDLNGLRQRFPISLSGATLRDIMRLGDHLALAPRALRIELDALHQVKLPAVLHWDLSHFVVLRSIDAKKAVIHDPAHGKRTVTLSELSNHFTGVVLEFEPTRTFEKVEARKQIGLTSLWSRLHGFWPSATQLLVLSLVLQLAALVAPFQTQLVIDESLASGDTDLLTVVAIGFGILALFQVTIDALRGWTLQILGSLMSIQMMGNLIHHLFRLPSSYFERRHMGDILSRLGSSSSIQQFFTNGVISVILDGIMAILAIVILFFYSTALAAVVVVSMVLAAIVALAFYPATRARSRERLVASAREQTFVMESVRAATTVKLMGREAERESDWRNLFGNVVNASLSVGKLSIASSFLQGIIGSIQAILVLYIGARMILDAQGLSVGMLMAFMAYRQMFTTHIGGLIDQYFQFRLLRLHLERLGDIVTAEPDTRPRFQGPRRFLGRITVRDVTFRYGEGDRPVFENLNLEIEPGDFLALTGPSGGGKTTLLKLLLGLEKPVSGDVLLDGVPASPERWQAWRTHVGVVGQDDRLLSGSIAENIAFFDPDMSMERVVKAAKAAQVHADIEGKPMQYRSLIGDMGSALSAGQRQRILLARALYRDPDILILDEGTANLDEDTENAIADLVAGLPITRIIVAHRPTLVGRARRVARLDKDGLKFNVGRAALAEGSF